MDVKGNDFNKFTRNYYKDKMKEANLLNALSAFESGESEDEDELAKQFADLSI